MKKKIYLLLFIVFLFSCKKNDSDSLCDDNYTPLTMIVQTYGEVLHPLTSNILFANNHTTIFPNSSFGLHNGSYSNFSLSIDGGDAMGFTQDYASVEIEEGLPIGIHSFDMQLDCTKEFTNTSDPVYCECVNEERYASIELNFVEPTYIRVDSLIFGQSLPCDGINGSLCPDVYFDWAYYNNIPNYITGNYYLPEDGPIHLAYGDTIAIYPSECTIPIEIYDSDQFNNNDYLGNAVMNPTNMNGWTTGSHQIESNFWVVITRLN